MFIELLQHSGLCLMLKFASSNAHAVLHHHWLFVATVYKAPSRQKVMCSVTPLIWIRVMPRDWPRTRLSCTKQYNSSSSQIY